MIDRLIDELIYFLKSQTCVILLIVVAPNLATEKKGGVYMSEIISFLVSVLASVVGYYICKWLDGDDSDN